MNNQAKIAELKKNINNKFFPEALKPKLLAQIEKLEAEDKQSQNKGIPPHPKPKQSKTSIATKEGEPKFNVGDSVKIKGGFTEAIVKSYKLNRKKEFVYTCKYVNPINETFQENESGLELFNSKNISYEEMSDEDFAFTTLGKICAADGKAWNETKANSGSDIRRSDELQKGYATSMNKQMKDLGIQKNSLDEKELDYLENYNYWLLIEFLSWNNYFTSKISENKKDYYKMAWDLHHIENPNQNSSTISNPENLIISKGILPHPKPKKPTIAKKVKSELKKYFAHREIKSVTVIEDAKKVVYKGEDVLNGAQFLAKGGKVDEIATYYPIRAIVEVTLKDGSKVKPANGYHIKHGAIPIAELGTIIEDSTIHYNIARLARGGELKVGDPVKYIDNKEIAKVVKVDQWNDMEDEVTIEFPDGKQIKEGSLSLHKVTPIAASLAHNPNSNLSQQEWLEKHNRYFEQGGYLEGFENFDYIKFLDYAQPKVEATLLEHNITLLSDYTIVRDGKEFEPQIIYKSIDGLSNDLSIAYYNDNDLSLTPLLTIDFELNEREYHIKSSFWKINDVDMYANGGWVKDNKYLNKSEAYEIRYAKGKNRKGYMEKGGNVESFDYKNKESYLPIGRKAKGVSVKEIAKMHNVTEKYLKKQLEKGQKIELEHTTDEAIAYSIAKDHIYENPDYYILLSQIEMKAKGGQVKTSKFKLNDILVPEKDGDYSEDFWKVTALDIDKNSMTISKLKNGKFTDDFTSSPENAEKGFRLANKEEKTELEKTLENWNDSSEFNDGGYVSKSKNINFPHPKPKREGSKKNINNKFFPEALKPKLLAQIEMKANDGQFPDFEKAAKILKSLKEDNINISELKKEINKLDKETFITLYLMALNLRKESDSDYANVRFKYKEDKVGMVEEILIQKVKNYKPKHDEKIDEMQNLFNDYSQKKITLEEYKKKRTEIINKGILPHPKIKPERSKKNIKEGPVNNPGGNPIFAKAKEIREPNEPWKACVKRAALLLKK